MPTIYLSPSTQAKNIGTDNVSEKERMRALADTLAPLLCASGYRVFVSSPAMTLIAVIHDSVARLARGRRDIHIALHSNASPLPGRATGIEAWVYARGGEGDRLGTAILRWIAPVLGLPLRPAKDGGLCKVAGADGIHLAEIGKTRVPAVLLELFFHDNPSDIRAFTLNRARLLTAMVAGIDQYYGRFKAVDAEVQKWTRLS